MVKILDSNCVRNVWQNVFFEFCLDFHEKYVFHKATMQYRRFKILISFLKNIDWNVLMMFLNLDCLP